MPDYPDWTRLFHLVGTEITIPINIEASDVTLPVSIDAVTADLDVTIVASEVALPISIDAATVTIDVSIVAQVGNITFEFADQSVAVFDAKAWFAHQAQGVIVWGQANVLDNNNELVASRVVPEDEVFFLCGVAYGMECPSNTPRSTYALITYDGVGFLTLGAGVGVGMTFDTPLRFTAGVTIRLFLWQLGSGATLKMLGSFWGYDEEA